MGKDINLSDIDPLLVLVNDPVDFLKDKIAYSLPREVIRRTQKEWYSKGFEVAVRTGGRCGKKPKIVEVKDKSMGWLKVIIIDKLPPHSNEGGEA